MLWLIETSGSPANCDATSPRSWYLQASNSQSWRDRTERILQVEEQILERFEQDLTDSQLKLEFNIWSDENSRARQEIRFQRRFSINVWADIVNNRRLGPYVLPKGLNAVQYLEFLNDVQLDVEVHLAERVRMWYLHDGAHHILLSQ